MMRPYCYLQGRAMKAIATFLVLTLLSLPAFADRAKCYADGKLIYSHRVKNVTFTGELLVFEEWGTDKIVFAWADCIIKIGG